MVGKMKNVNSRAAWYLQACRYDTSYHRIPWYFFQKLPPVGWKESSTTTMYIFLSRKNARKKDRIYKFDTILFFQLFRQNLPMSGVPSPSVSRSSSSSSGTPSPSSSVSWESGVPSLSSSVSSFIQKSSYFYGYLYLISV